MIRSRFKMFTFFLCSLLFSAPADASRGPQQQGALSVDPTAAIRGDGEPDKLERLKAGAMTAMHRSFLLPAFSDQGIMVADLQPMQTPEQTKGKLVLGLAECITLAIKAAPELGEAQADIDFLKSRLDEAKSYRFPQLEVVSLAGPAPGAKKQDLFATDWKFSTRNLTWFSRTDASIVQPLYTFGKISENMKAATHGIEVNRAGKTLKVNEVALKVREYYFGILLAREMKELVLEVQETLLGARKKAQQMLDQDSPGVEESDIFKLDAYAGEVGKFLEEAIKGEKLALAALKTRIGLAPDAQFDIVSQRLSLDDASIPDIEALIEKGKGFRPEFRQLSEGIKARSALVEAARAGYYPDIFLGGYFSWGYSDKRDRINNPYIYDPFQHTVSGVALGVRWKLDFGITGSKVAGEVAQHDRLLSTRMFAETFIPLQIRKAYLELKEAENSAASSKQAYTNAKRWAVSAVANFDFGVGPAKEIFEALQAYARMRASYFQSIYNYRIAQANLDYAIGEAPLQPAVKLER